MRIATENIFVSLFSAGHSQSPTNSQIDFHIFYFFSFYVLQNWKNYKLPTADYKSDYIIWLQ